MDFVYTDETGLDQERPLVVMAGIVVNDERLSRTQDDLATVLAGVGGIPAGTLQELKGKTLIQPEKYTGELAHYQECIDMPAPRLLPRSHRWPMRSKSACAQWYRAVAPDSLLTLA